MLKLFTLYVLSTDLQERSKTLDIYMDYRGRQLISYVNESEN